MFLCVFDELHIYQFIVLIGTLIYIGCNGYFHIIFYCLRCDDSIDTPESIFIGTVDRCFNVFGRLEIPFRQRGPQFFYPVQQKAILTLH